MIAVARKNLLNDKAKFLVSVGGVALSTLLILALLGVYFGIEKQSQTIPLTSGANYWVTERGAKNLFNSASFLPTGRQQALKSIKGVEDAVPIIDRTTTVKIKGKDVTTAVVGYDTKTGIGRAGGRYKGAASVGHHEVIVDRAMAQKHGLKIGDGLRINDVDFKIVGLSDNTNDMEFQYVFISFRDAAETLRQPAINYYLINLSVPPARVRPAINRVLPTGELKTKETVAKGNVTVIRDTFLPVIGLLVFIGLAVGTTVIGLTIYTATAERSKEYGVLKAVGVKNRRLFGIVLQQTVISSVLGFAVGVGLYFLVEHFSFYVVPTVSFWLSAGYFGAIFLLSLFAGVLAALIPLRKINRIDPVEAFSP
jgi:putative ABC transport system permease protein